MKLHIGCQGERIDGFKRLDIVQHGDVDYVQNAKDLSNFSSDSVDEIYASHILEHFDNLEIPHVLNEWKRVLVPRGLLWISVPDFDSVVEMYLRNGRRMTTWMHHVLHGDQINKHSIHYQSFTYPMLSAKLSEVGFVRVDRIQHLPYDLADASEIVDNAFQVPISINLKAIK